MNVSSIRLFGRHGVHDFEAEHGGLFELDLFLETTDEVPRDDAPLDKILDYSAVAATAREVFHSRRYRLIEALAYDIARTIASRWSALRKIEVRVRKIRPPLGMEAVSAEVVVVYESEERAGNEE